MALMMIWALALAADATPAPTPPAPPAAELPAWLAGCWMASGADDTQTEECWTAPRGSMLLGSSHSFAGGRSGWFEHMRMVVEDGRLAYVAQPGGAPPTRFDAAAVIRVDGREMLIFRNLDNDYPQRITYSYNPANPREYLAEIAMDDGSRAQSWVFRR